MMRYITIKVFLLTLTFFIQYGETFQCGVPELKKHIGTQVIPDVPSAPAHPAAPELIIGSQRTFFAIDFAKKQQYTINATLQGSGAHCYIYVENSEWRRNVSPLTVQTIQNAFDISTPADPNRGIYQILTEDIGPIPDIDRNQKVIILLLNIRDVGNTHSTVGYFMPIDQHRGILQHPTLGPLHSNVGEILYIDARDELVKNFQMQAVIAHELQHIIHWEHSPKEETWIDEGCANYAAFRCGYDIHQHVKAFQEAPNTSLIDWSQMTQTNLLAHYGAAFIFMMYIHDHYGGMETIAELVKNPLDGISGITNTLEARGMSNTFSNVFSDWKVANYLTTWGLLGSIGKQYRYITFKTIISPQFIHNTYPVNRRNETLVNFAAHAIDCKVASADQVGLNFSFTTQRNTKVDIRVAYLRDSGEISVESLPFKTTDGTAILDLPTFGSNVKRAILIPSLQVENPSFAQQTITYNYGVFEGGLGTYSTKIIPNPIHPNYWEIIAVPDEASGIVSLTVTLTYQNRNLFEDKPMVYIQNADKNRYRYAFHLKPEIDTEAVEWSIRRGDTIINEGVLDETTNDK